MAEPRFDFDIGGYACPNISGWVAFYSMLSLARYGYVPYRITSPQLPGYAVYFTGEGRPYVALCGTLMTYGGMQRGA